eukprot:3373781-Lingulodinium_polyedra.AAC.1
MRVPSVFPVRALSIQTQELHTGARRVRPWRCTRSASSMAIRKFSLELISFRLSVQHDLSYPTLLR